MYFCATTATSECEQVVPRHIENHCLLCAPCSHRCIRRHPAHPLTSCCLQSILHHLRQYSIEVYVQLYARDSMMSCLWSILHDLRCCIEAYVQLYARDSSVLCFLSFLHDLRQSHDESRILQYLLLADETHFTDYSSSAVEHAFKHYFSELLGLLKEAFLGHSKTAIWTWRASVDVLGDCFKWSKQQCGS